MKSTIAQNLMMLLALPSLLACAETRASSPMIHTVSPGVYQQQLKSGSTDILTINSDDSMTLEHTRQVGGPGGISKDGVVPYPTVCRIKVTGVIISESTTTIEYEVRSVELSDISGLKDSEHCEEYVRAFNSMVPQRLRFTAYLSDFGLNRDPATHN